MSEAFDEAWLILKYKDYRFLGRDETTKPRKTAQEKRLIRPREDVWRGNYWEHDSSPEPPNLNAREFGALAHGLNFPSPNFKTGWHPKRPNETVLHRPQDWGDNENYYAIQQALEIPMKQAVQEAIGRSVSPEEMIDEHRRNVQQRNSRRYDDDDDENDWDIDEEAEKHQGASAQTWQTLPDEPYPDAGKGEFSEGEYLWPRGTPESMLPDQLAMLLEGKWPAKGWEEFGPHKNW